MTGPEAGFLLLSCRLGNPERRVLSTAQMRMLSHRMKDFQTDDPDRDVSSEDLVKLGYGTDLANRIVALLDEEDLLLHYLRKAQMQTSPSCVPKKQISFGMSAFLFFPLRCVVAVL